MLKKYLVLLIISILTPRGFCLQQGELALFLTIEKHPVYIYDNSVILYTASMAIDADGSPEAYHPLDIGSDYLANAGRPGNWWALATDTGKKDGTPFIQGKDAPAPGYYVSMTSLFDPARKRSDPGRYVNADKIPYIVVPRSLYDKKMALPGDMAIVYDIKTGTYCPAIIADVGSDKNIGEGSICLARKFLIPADPKTGGCEERRFVYLVFTGSGNRRPCNPGEIEKKAVSLFKKLGGKRLLEYYLTPVKKELRR